MKSLSDELRHYGVLGMRWGQHKAIGYVQDTNSYIRKKANKKVKSIYRSGGLSKNAYKAKIQANKEKEAKSNVAAYKKLVKLTPKKGAKISSIYKAYKDKAIETIPNYRLKKGAKFAAKMALRSIPLIATPTAISGYVWKNVFASNGTIPATAAQAAAVYGSVMSRKIRNASSTALGTVNAVRLAKRVGVSRREKKYLKS